MAAAKVMVVEDMFEAARKAFFSTGDTSPSAALPKARETVFTKEVPTAPEAAVEQKLAGAQEEEAQILVHA